MYLVIYDGHSYKCETAKHADAFLRSMGVNVRGLMVNLDNMDEWSTDDEMTSVIKEDGRTMLEIPWLP